MITEFHVKNYKCLADVTIPLTPIHVLIGQNDTGKTSLLEAVANVINTLVTTRPTGDSSSWSDSTKLIEYDILTRPYNKTVYKTRLSLKLNGNTPNISEIQFNGISMLHAQQTPEEFSNLQSYYAPKETGETLQIISLKPKQLSKASESYLSASYRLSPDGYGLPTLLDEITGYDVGLFLKIQEQFSIYMPQYKKIRLIPTNIANSDATPVHGKEIFLSTASKDIRLANASDGAAILLGFLALAYSPNPPRVILLEEPENGIHPQRLKEIARLLRSFTQREENAPQIIMTTHSPYLLSEFQPEEVTLMRRHIDGTVKAHPLRDAKHIRERMGKEFYLGELWYNLDEDELLR